MNAYLDLSYIFHLCTLANIPYYFNKIFKKKITNLEMASLGFFSIVLYFNVFMFSDLPYINYLFLLVFFMIVYLKQFVKHYVLYLLVYFGNVSTSMLFSDDLYLFNGLVFLNEPRAIFYVFSQLINILTIEVIMLSVRKIRLLKNYYADIKVKIDNTYINMKGYIDSGNTLLVEGVPVIFLKDEYFGQGKYQEMIVRGVGMTKSKYFKTKIIIYGEEKEVVCASGSNQGYKGCDCLINIYLLEEEKSEIVK